MDDVNHQNLDRDRLRFVMMTKCERQSIEDDIVSHELCAVRAEAAAKYIDVIRISIMRSDFDSIVEF